jgi:Tol biopolymer transport system component
MKIRLVLFISLAILLLYPAASSFAQGGTQAQGIHYGDTVAGEIPDVDTGAFYAFEGQAGDQVTLTVVGTDIGFQPFLGLFTIEQVEVASTVTGLIENQALPQDGLYIIVIISDSGAGHFTLTLKKAGGGSGGLPGLGSQGGGQTGVQSGSGRIAYASNPSGEWQIYTVNPDGSDLRQLTSDAGSKFTPMWSPDGTQIAYRFWDGTRWAIYGMKADGSNQHAIGQGTTSDFSAAWSPDGKLLVVGSGSDWNACDIYLMNADGSNRQLVANTGQTANSPVWWPDGESIVFNRIENGVTSVYAVNPDGSGLKMLVENARDPSISPDGKVLATSSQRNGNWDLYMVIDSQLYQLTQSPEEEARPMWSPDGKQLAFMQSGDGGNTWQIMVISLDDGQITPLTSSTANSVDEHWSPR